MSDNRESRTGNAPSREEIASANELMFALVKSVKAIRTYLSNSPVRAGFLDELAARMTDHIHRFGELWLDVEPFALSYRGTTVYESREPRESLALRLHADGVRTLIFSSGIGQDELAAFLEIVSSETGDGQDSGIVTRLWERSLQHLECLLADDFLQAAPEVEVPPPLPSRRLFPACWPPSRRAPLPRRAWFPSTCSC